MLSQKQNTLCAECHELADESFTRLHAGVDAAVMNCVTCHNPHTSKDPKYFKSVVHAPFAARSCDACHVVGKE